MTNIDWRSLAIEAEDRSAIFSEHFPARLAEALPDGYGTSNDLAAFDTTAALEVLATFAGAWGSLHQDGNGHRWPRNRKSGSHRHGVPGDPA